MMMLEELDDVGVEWDQDDRGAKVARFIVSIATFACPVLECKC